MRCQKYGQDNLSGAQACTGCGTTLVTIAEQIVLPGQNAGFWIRIAACGVDSFIIAFIGLIINSTASYLQGRTGTPARLALGVAFPGFVFIPLAFDCTYGTDSR